MCTSACIMWEPSAQSAVSAHLRAAATEYLAGRYDQALACLGYLTNQRLSRGEDEWMTALKTRLTALAAREIPFTNALDIFDCLVGHVETYRLGQVPVIVSGPPVRPQLATVTPLPVRQPIALRATS